MRPEPNVWRRPYRPKCDGRPAASRARRIARSAFLYTRWACPSPWSESREERPGAFGPVAVDGLGDCGVDLPAADQLLAAMRGVVREVVRGIRRSLGTVQRRAVPVLVTDLRAMLGTLPDGLLGQSDRAFLLSRFAGAFSPIRARRLNLD